MWFYLVIFASSASVVIPQPYEGLDACKAAAKAAYDNSDSVSPSYTCVPAQRSHL